MLKEYSISDILSTSEYHPYYIGTFENTEDHDIEWAHRHSFFSLVWFTKGEGFYVVDFQECEIKPQRLFIVNPKQVHNWDYSSNCKGYVLMVDDVIGREFGMSIFAPYADVQDLYVPILEHCFKNLIAEFGLKDNLSDSNIKTGVLYLYSIVRRILMQQTIGKTLPNSLIDKFHLLISDNPNLQTVEQYAACLQVPTDELNQACKIHTGISPKKYALDLKITEAKRLLLFSKLNINEISFCLGFEDSSYFSRLFKKKTGLSPSDFLEKYRKQD